MNQVEFAGLTLVGLAAYHLIPAVSTATISTRWPFKPLRRAESPEECQTTFAVF